MLDKVADRMGLAPRSEASLLTDLSKFGDPFTQGVLRITDPTEMETLATSVLKQSHTRAAGLDQMRNWINNPAFHLSRETQDAWHEALSNVDRRLPASANAGMSSDQLMASLRRTLPNNPYLEAMQTLANPTHMRMFAERYVQDAPREFLGYSPQAARTAAMENMRSRVGDVFSPATRNMWNRILDDVARSTPV
jgi:hypothetical protein